MREHKQNWRDIFSCFRIALDGRKIILGTLGIYISILAIYLLLLVTSPWQIDAPTALQNMLHSPLQWLRSLGVCMRTMNDGCSGCECGPSSFREAAFVGVAGVLMLAIWSFFGGAIARLAAIDFAKGERIEIAKAGTFACKKFGSFFWSPVAPLIFVAVFLFCNYLLGMVGRIPGIGPIAVGLLFFLSVLSGFFVVILLIGTTLGFPFMWPTIAMEGTDAFDAISRSFNYLFARPWKTLWCWLVALAYGLATMAFVVWFIFCVLRIARASVGAGMGPGFEDICSFVNSGIPPDGTQWPMLAAMVLVRTLIILVGGLFLGYLASFKMTAFTVIYAIIRRDVDGTDMSEAYLPEAVEPPAAPAAPATEEQKPEA